MVALFSGFSSPALSREFKNFEYLYHLIAMAVPEQLLSPEFIDQSLSASQQG
jgi:hypothetical protein